MSRISITISKEKLSIEQLLIWANAHSHFCYLNSNNTFYPDSKYKGFKNLLAVGCIDICSPKEDSLNNLQRFIDNSKDWLFGYLDYNLKNQVENLETSKPKSIMSSELSFFIPKFVVEIEKNHFNIQIHSSVNTNNLLDDIKSIQPELIQPSPILLIQKTSKEEYLRKVKKVKEHIQLGDVYELNLCQEFNAEKVYINPLKVYTDLNTLSPTPFSTFLKINDIYCIGSSPERFLKKEGKRLISQPIKGTSKRGNTPQEDEKLKYDLLLHEKDKRENVMIVDLVRNDLSRTATKGSVKVNELFGIYTFPQVHQMISTVSSEVNPNTSITEIIQTTFPMGSMTGAPKIRAMELIDKYEDTARGIFSGAIGYITPKQDFDFNVVIRSILYDDKNQKLSFSVGGAITSLSNSEDEYEETLLKAKALLKVLE